MSGMEYLIGNRIKIKHFNTFICSFKGDCHKKEKILIITDTIIAA